LISCPEKPIDLLRKHDHTLFKKSRQTGGDGIAEKEHHADLIVILGQQHNIQSERARDLRQAVACRHVAVQIGPGIELLPIADPPPDKVPVVYLT
jgi:hypothetical protein